MISLQQVLGKINNMKQIRKRKIKSPFPLLHGFFSQRAQDIYTQRYFSTLFTIEESERKRMSWHDVGIG